MDFIIHLKAVTLRQVSVVREVASPVYSTDSIQVNGQECAMQVEGVGSFYICNGNEVEYSPLPDADPAWVQLTLNSQVLVALMHQRQIINFHASSFIHDGKGIMLLGETGAGKSSLTASFTLSGAAFLSDDLTPVIFKDSKPYIRPLYRTIKLKGDTVRQLNIDDERLTTAETGTGKHYMHVEHSGVEAFQLHTIIKIEIGETAAVTQFSLPDPALCFSLLRSEICSWEMLRGMPATEADYLRQLLLIAAQAKVIRVVRPAGIGITELQEALKRYLKEDMRLEI